MYYKLREHNIPYNEVEEIDKELGLDEPEECEVIKPEVTSIQRKGSENWMRAVVIRMPKDMIDQLDKTGMKRSRMVRLIIERYYKEKGGTSS